jgi:serine/threonine protein phosphatase PrpC
VRRREIFRLNEDRSFGPEIDQEARARRISLHDASLDERRTHLRSCLGGEDINLIDRSRTPLLLEASDVIILASDGLLSLSQSEILNVVNAHIRQVAEDIAEALITASSLR